MIQTDPITEPSGACIALEIRSAQARRLLYARRNPGGGMYYVVSFDGCGIESPLQAQSPESTLALAKEAERNGCRNVVVKLPDGGVLTPEQFAAAYCRPGVAGKA